MFSRRTSKILSIVLLTFLIFSTLLCDVFATQTIVDSTIKGSDQIVTFYIDQQSYKKGSTIVATDVAPYIKDGRTMIPVAIAASALGADKTEWTPESQTVRITRGNDIISLKIGSKELVVNGEISLMDTAAEIKDVGDGGGRTMLPIAYIAKALNVGYKWDGNTRSVDFYGYSEAFEKKGTYGPSKGIEIIAGNVIITAGDVRLQNKVIKGNLIIEVSPGDEDIFLDNIVVEGNTYIRGGDKRTIHIDGGSYQGQVVIENMINNDAAEIVLGKTTIVREILFNASTTVQAYGEIEAIHVSANNIVIFTDTPPKIHEVSPGYDPATILPLDKPVPLGSPTVGGGGGGGGDGGGSTIVKVTNITVSPKTMKLTVNGDTGTLTATISPTDATNKKVKWTSSDETVAAVNSSGIVTPVAARNGYHYSDIRGRRKYK